jgi:predicted dehydrogenase/threonine dehydrogenase-like Zn-dependent dehydrogenase
MYQAILKKKIKLETIPSPSIQKGLIKIKTFYSCISAGTEISAVNNASSSLFQKALNKPEQVKQVLSKISTDGIKKTITKVNEKLNEPIATGYSISGIVVEVSPEIQTFKVGDRVAASGANFAMHAEYVVVPKNLVTKCPEKVELKHAATVTLGCIALHGIRRANLKIGEFCVIYGAGLLGLISLQILKSSNIRVIVVDINNDRLNLAKSLGAEFIINPTTDNTIDIVNNLTNNYGADSVLFTASTKSSDPLSNAFNIIKKKGTLVLVGVSGMEIKREDIYKKEIDFKISCSYGPGRYDKNYEINGVDYPYAYVRWTENRNMQEYLRLLEINNIDIEPLLSNIYKIENVETAFDSLKKTPETIMVLLDYSHLKTPEKTKINLRKNIPQLNKKVINIGLIGTGSFATAMHLPNLKKLNKQFRIKAISNKTGVKAKYVAESYNADYVTTDYNDLLNDTEIDLIFITTPHNTHAKLVSESLKANKHVFVEKPLAINYDELNELKDFFKKTKSPPYLFVGFNRRHSPLVQEMKNATSNSINPIFLNYTVNAGKIDESHWVYDQGGRIIGEGCHFIDTCTYLTNSSIETITSHQMNFKNVFFKDADNISFSMKYKNGSIATINYFSLGSQNLEKEKLEVHFDGKSIILNDFKQLKGFSIKVKEFNLKSANKGQYEELIYIHKTILENKLSSHQLFKENFETTHSTFLISEIE